MDPLEINLLAKLGVLVIIHSLIKLVNDNKQTGKRLLANSEQHDKFLTSGNIELTNPREISENAPR
jgi:hypothetical protein